MSASTPVVYEIPEGPRIELDLPARLWAAAAKGPAAALAEGEWVAHVMERIRLALNAISGDIALRLDVGLGQDVGRHNNLYPLYKNDLENYLSPIAKELPNRVVSVWANQGPRRVLLCARRARKAHAASPVARVPCQASLRR